MINSLVLHAISAVTKFYSCRIKKGFRYLTLSLQLCHGMVDRAFNECSSGMNRAQSQCKGVMAALSIVYRHAQKVLDHINPDRWAPKLVPEEHDHLFRRDTIIADRLVVHSDT